MGVAPSHPLARQAVIRCDDCEGLPFLRAIARSPVLSALAPEFARFWESVSPHLSCNATPRPKRMILFGQGI